jgi:hypothetical protein
VEAEGSIEEIEETWDGGVCKEGGVKSGEMYARGRFVLSRRRAGGFGGRFLLSRRRADHLTLSFRADHLTLNFRADHLTLNFRADHLTIYCSLLRERGGHFAVNSDA